MDNLLFKEKMVVAVWWVASFWVLGSGWYNTLSAQSDASNLAITTGVAITFFSMGLVPKVFTTPLQSIPTAIKSPILLKAPTLQYFLLSGVAISSIGLGIKLLT